MQDEENYPKTIYQCFNCKYFVHDICYIHLHGSVEDERFCFWCYEANKSGFIKGNEEKRVTKQHEGQGITFSNQLSNEKEITFVPTTQKGKKDKIFPKHDDLTKPRQSVEKEEIEDNFTGNMDISYE
jgi:hypothetical protein